MALPELRMVVRALLLAFAVYGWATRVAAQACHGTPPAPLHATGSRVSAYSEYGSFDNARYRGRFESLGLRLHWATPDLDLGVASVVHHVTANGLTRRGWGDSQASARLRVWQAQERRWSWGGQMVGSWPSAAHATLGMGHPMLAGSLWSLWDNSRTFWSAQVGYAQALTAGGHHGASGLTPVVDPMNAREGTAVTQLGTQLIAQWLSARAGLNSAWAFGAGRARGVGLLALDSWTQQVGTSLEVHTGLWGQPFDAKLRLAITYKL